jgi:hypothetical protein
VLREIRQVISERNYIADKDKFLNKPIIVSTLAAVGIPKLKLLCTENTIFLRTNVNVPAVKEEITRTQSLKKIKTAENQLGDKDNTEGGKNQEQTEDEKIGEGDSETKENAEKAKEMQLVKFIEKEAVGAEAGITPDFIVSQASDNFITNLDDLFNLFDAFQNAFYSGEAQFVMKSDQKEEEEQIDEDKAVYEESILQILGENYMDFIDSTTGEWVNENTILDHFSKIFSYELEAILRSKNVNQ